MSDTSRYIASDDYVAAIRDAVVQNNPNDAATEDIDEAAIKDLANYAAANGMIEGPYEEDQIVVDKLFDPYSPDCLAYFLYDVMKWTRANGATVELDGELI